MLSGAIAAGRLLKKGDWIFLLCKSSLAKEQCKEKLPEESASCE
jgi:hypothetical protein